MRTNAKPENMPMAAPAHKPDPRRPVVFLNPNVLSKVARVGMVQSEASRISHQPQVISLADGPAQAFETLVREAGAVVVCTDVPFEGYDVRSFVMDRGVRGDAFAPDWFSSRDRKERARGVEAWLVRHGAPTAIIIDRPPNAERSAAAGHGTIITISVAEGQELTASVCSEVIGHLRSGAG